MAKDDGYQGALDSIFGFIFSNNKKDSKPLKPPKSTGVSGTNELASVLAELASKPAVYLGDEALGRVNDTLDADLFRVQLREHKDDDDAEIRIRTKDLGKLLADPNKYFDAAVKRPLREANKSIVDMITGGQLVDQMIGYGVAKKLGVDHESAMNVGLYAGKRDEMHSIGSLRKKGHEMYAENAVLEGLRNGVITQAKAEELVDKIGNANAMQFDGKRLEGILISSGVGSPAGILDEFNKQLKGSHFSRDGRMTHIGFGLALRTNLGYKADIAVGDAKKSLLKAQGMVDAWTRIRDGKGEGQFPNLEATMEDLDSNLDALRSSTRPEDRAYRKALVTKKRELRAMQSEQKAWEDKYAPVWRLGGDDYKWQNAERVRRAYDKELDTKWILNRKLWKEAKDVGDRTAMRRYAREGALILDSKKAVVKLPLASFHYRLGKVNKYRSYLTNFLKGGEGKFISGGVFFAADVNEGAPGMITASSLQRRGRGGTYDDATFVYVVSRGKEELDPRLAGLSNLYYLTPGSISKTLLFNGEAFAFMAQRAAAPALKKLIGDKAVVSYLTSDPRFAHIFTKKIQRMVNGKMKTFTVPIDITDKKAVAEAMKSNFLNVLDILEAHPAFSTLYGITDVRRVYERYSNLAFAFSVPKRMINDRIKLLFEKTIKKRLDTVLKRSLRKLIDTRQWRDTVGQFFKRQAGLRELVLMALKSVGGAFAGPLGVVLSWIVSEAVMRALPGIVAGVMKTAVLIIWGVVFLIFGMGAMAMQFGSTASSTNAWNHRFPEKLQTLAGENPYGPEIKDGLTYDGPALGDAPPGSTCPILGNTLICMQGPEGGFTHAAMGTGAIDISSRSIDPVWYAPSSGTVTSYSASNTCSDGKDYGGVLYFTDNDGNSYRLIHVKAVVSSGKVAKGKPVAILRFDLERSFCWTGAHFHLDTRVGGGWTNSEEWYRDKLGCNVSACSN